MRSSDLKMTIKGGKFFKEGKEVPAEHGNKEQIELLKRANDMANEGFSPEIHIYKKIKMEFQCLCGAINTFDSFNEIDLDDPDTMIRGEIDHCHNCNQKYKVIEDEFGDLALKLVPKVKEIKVTKV